jgi:hypothetical protein
VTLAALGSAGCTSLPPLRSARSLQSGKSQGNVILQSVDAHYSKDVSGSAPTEASEDSFKSIGAVSGEYRGGTQVPGLDIGLGLGSLSSLYLDFKEQFIGKPWREGFAAAIDLELDYFPWTFYTQNSSQFSSGFGGSAGLLVAQYLGFCDLNLGGRFGCVPQGTLYAYFTLFDVPGVQAGGSNYYEFSGSLDFTLSRNIGISAGTAYRTYVNQENDFVTPTQTVRMTLPGFFIAAITMSFGGQVPLFEKDLKPPKSRRERRSEVNALDLIEKGKQFMDSKDYAAAAMAFKEADRSGSESQQLDMRLGYCYYQLKDWASALSYYRKAQLYAPDDEKLKHAIEKLEQKIPDAQDSDAPLPAE